MTSGINSFSHQVRDQGYRQDTVAVTHTGNAELPPEAQPLFTELLEGGLLSRWPSKKAAQAKATLWLAMQLQPERVYLESEIDWLIATRFTRTKVPDCPTIRKEFERHGLVEREPGGGGFTVLVAAAQAALRRWGS